MIESYFNEIKSEYENLPGRFLFSLSLNNAAPLNLGCTGTGNKRAVMITGGQFRGPRLQGSVIAGEDWITEASTAILNLDVRLTLVTSDGTPILMRYRGIRHGSEEVMGKLKNGEPVSPKDYYFRICPTFTTSVTKFSWLNGILAVGYGSRTAESVEYSLYEIL